MRLHRLRHSRAVAMTVAAIALTVAAAARPWAAEQPAATLAVDGRANANPSLTSSGQFVAVAWSAATISAMDVYAALSRDGGRTFSAPVRVNDVDGDARVNSELPPRIVLVPRARRGGSAGGAPDMVVVW